MNNVLVLLADGFEDIEVVTTVDLLRRANIDVNLVSIKDKIVKSGTGINVVVEKLIEEVSVDDYDLLFLPGGGGVKALDESKLVRKIILDFYDQGKYISAICAAPLILGKMGLLDNKDFTCYPSFEQFAPKGIYKEVGVIQSDNIITGRAIGYVNDFAFHIIDLLTSNEIKENVAKQTLISENK